MLSLYNYNHYVTSTFVNILLLPKMKYMTKTFFLNLQLPSGFLSHSSYFLLLAVPLLIVVLFFIFFGVRLLRFAILKLHL